MESQRCKGSRDLLPQDMERFRHVENAFRSSCLEWGYREIRTPTLEYLHLFTSTGTLTPGMLGRIYSFLDWDGWSGERVVLRPDSTIPAARLYIDNLLAVRPAKLFYVQNVFRFENTGRESRERWQCGAEIIGSAGPLADVELIMLAAETLGRLGIRDARLRLSHAGMIRGLLSALGLSSAEQGELFDRMLDGETGVFGKVISDHPGLKEPLSLLLEGKGTSAGYLRNLKASLARAFPDSGLDASMADFITIAECLSELGCEYEIDMASGRGFEYYTGVIFRFYCGEEALGGGGRYNDLIPLLGGGDVSASGFALNVDQLMGLTEDWQDAKPTVLVRTGADTARAQKLCFDVAGLLRQAGYVAELDRGYKRPTHHAWVLSVQVKGKSPVFVLTDRAGTSTIKVTSPNAIVDALQVADAGETGPS